MVLVCILLTDIVWSRFYIIPLGCNSVSRGLAGRCPVYASLFLDDNWRDLLEKGGGQDFFMFLQVTDIILYRYLYAVLRNPADLFIGSATLLVSARNYMSQLCDSDCACNFLINIFPKTAVDKYPVPPIQAEPNKFDVAEIVSRVQQYLTAGKQCPSSELAN